MAEDIAYFVIVVLCALIFAVSLSRLLPERALADRCPRCEVPPQTAWVAP
jgi:hypothetical protein